MKASTAYRVDSRWQGCPADKVHQFVRVIIEETRFDIDVVTFW